MPGDSFDPAAYLQKQGIQPAVRHSSDDFDPAAYLKSQGVTPAKDAAKENSEAMDLLGSLRDVGGKAGNAISGLLANTVVPVAKKIDSYTGAPVRAGLGALQEHKDFFPAYREQFGNTEHEAPTGKELMQRAGVSERPLLEYTKSGNPNIDESLARANAVVPSRSTVAGLVTDVATDPSTYALGAAEKVWLLGKAVDKGGEIAGKVLPKVGEALTGIPDHELTTYAKHRGAIKQMYKESAGSTAEAADQIRSKYMQDITKTRQGLNAEIGQALKDNPKQIDSAPIIDAMNEQKAKVNSKLNPEQVDEIDDQIKKVQSLADQGGFIRLQDAQDLKQYLMDMGRGAYKKNGQIFAVGDDTARASRNGAAVARKSIAKSEPSIAAANEKLAEMHDIEDTMNKNLIAEGKPEASLMAAGSKGNERNVKALGRLGELTGTDMQGEAEKLAAMRTFGSPKLMPVDTTGKSATRVGLATGLGYLAGHVPGALAAGAMTSPLAMRTMIDAGLLGKEAVGPLMRSAAGQALLKEGLLRGTQDERK